MALPDYTLRPSDLADSARPQWVANFKEASQKQVTPPSPEVLLTSNEYSCGNIDSEAFFRNHAASVAEAERLRNSCRAAAQRSVARNPEEKVVLSYFDKAVSTATSVGQYSRTFHAQSLGDPLHVPPHLGHLLLPKPTIPLEAQAAALQALQAQTQQVLLPGAIEDPEPAAPPSAAAPPLPPPADSGAAGAPEGSAEARLLAAAAGTQPTAPATGVPSHQEPAAAEGPGDRVAPGGALSRSPDHKGTVSDMDVDGFGEDEVPEVPIPQATMMPAVPTTDKAASSRGSASDSDSEGSEGWPPKPPLMRFKGRMQFSQRFRPQKQQDQLVKLPQEPELPTAEQKSEPLQDRVVAWINVTFAMEIATEFQFEVTYPVIILTMLDAIYSRRVNWREIDLRYQYKRALQQNYQILERIWGEVNMDKAREFRVENTHLRLESIPSSPLKDKLDFLWLMHRWYNQRFHNADQYEPLARRRAIVKQCATWGHTVRWPPWILHDKEEAITATEETFRDMWRVGFKTSVNVMSTKGGMAEVIATKKPGETFAGHQDGDWIMLLDEPGWIMRVVYESREKLVEKQEKFRVVSKHETPILSAPRKDAAVIGKKTFGDVVFGYLQNDWVELSSERGFMHVFPAGGRKFARILETCTREDYKKMPEFKRLMWFLGSQEHLTM